MAKKQAPTEKADVLDIVTTEQTPKNRKPRAKKVDKFDPLSVSQSTKTVVFEWSKGDKSGTKEKMSDNVAEIMEHKGLGTKVK